MVRMKHLKSFNESFLDWFKDEPSPQQKQEQDAVNKILPKSFSDYMQSKDFKYTLTDVVGLYTHLISDLKSELVGKTYMNGKRDFPYTYTDCDKLVDSWMKKTNYKIYKINNGKMGFDNNGNLVNK